MKTNRARKEILLASTVTFRSPYLSTSASTKYLSKANQCFERTFNPNAETNPQCIRYINQSLREPKKPRDESPDMTVATQEHVNITVLREAQAKQNNATSADPCDKKGLSVMLYTKRGVYRQ